MKLTPSIIPDSGLQSVVESFHKAPVDNPVQQVLRAALERLGPNGERWFQGSCRAGDAVCAVTSLGIAVTNFDRRNDWNYLDGAASPVYKILLEAAKSLGHYGVETMSDGAESFADIRALFHRAITLAGQQVGV